MEEFYQTLKDRIEETELLIQQKDRELFEDILSRTLSQQLTDRIAESRRCPFLTAVFLSVNSEDVVLVIFLPI